MTSKMSETRSRIQSDGETKVKQRRREKVLLKAFDGANSAGE